MNPDSYAQTEARHITQLQNALTNPSPAMAFFSASELYAFVGKPEFDQKLHAAIGAAFDKNSERERAA